MANLDFIKRLNEQYGKSSPITQETRLFAINEAINPDKLEKALPNSLASMGPVYSRYFDFGLPADVALLFIDVCNFSTRFAHLNGEGIASFFDNYYDIVIPIIYKHGGEIDKIIGDGIVCIFGPPFLNGNIELCIAKANNCAKEIIKATKGTLCASKIAFHSGTINYFKNKTGLYKEFTLIGKPLTEIFRLESVSIDERINYYGNTNIEAFYKKSISNSMYTTSNPHAQKESWNHKTHKLPLLKGVEFENFYSINFI